MGHRIHNSRSKAKSFARTHGFQTASSGAKSGPVVVRKLTAEEMAAKK
jgi:hypothetical protein